MPSFTNILDRAPSTVEKPKPLPPGTYDTILQGMPRRDVSAKKQTPFIEFQHKIVAAGDDVDADALREALTSPDGEVKALNEIVMKNTYYLTENALWRLKQFLSDCGFDTDDDGSTLQQMVEETNGVGVKIYVKHVPSQDGQTIFAQIDKTLPAE